MRHPATSAAVRVLLTWTMLCLAPDAGLARVLAAVEPPSVTESGSSAEPAQSGADVGAVETPVVVERRGRTRIRLGGPVVVEKGERVEDVVAIFGSVTVRGEVHGNAVAVGGSVRGEQGATIRGDVVAIGGGIEMAPDVRLSGRAEHVAIGFPEIRVYGSNDPEFSLQFLPDRRSIAGALAGVSIFRLTALLLLGLAAALVFSSTVGRTADVAAHSPLQALVIGVGLQLLLVPALIVLSLSLAVMVVGLPLIPVVLVAAGAVWLVGFTGATSAAGRGVLRAVGIANPSLLSSFLLGGLPVAVLAIVSRIGWVQRDQWGGWPLALALAALLIEGLLWSIGAGALAMTWIRRRDPLPVAAAPPPTPPPGLPVQL